MVLIVYPTNVNFHRVVCNKTDGKWLGYRAFLVWCSMRRLIIQIPCFNEEKSLPITLQELPRKVAGFDEVLWLVIDDGSTDDTVRVAHEGGVDHIVRVGGNRGLANAFRTGITACLQLGADVIVNTDADNQYRAADIPKLTAPILAGEAEIVIGARPISTTEHFSKRKKILQKLGSWVVRIASATEVADAPSGFRAFSKEAATRLNVFGDYTYTVETIIQAGWQRMRIVSVPIQTNADLRPSRLLTSISMYVRASAVMILRSFVAYRPFHFFGVSGILVLGSGVLLGLRFLYFWFTVGGSGHIQSLILASVLLSSGFLLMVVALLADLISINRKLLEKIDRRLCQLEQNDPPHLPSDPKDRSP